MFKAERNGKDTLCTTRGTTALHAWFMGHSSQSRGGPSPQPSRICVVADIYGRFLNLSYGIQVYKLQTMQPHFKLIDSRRVTYELLY